MSRVLSLWWIAADRRHGGRGLLLLAVLAAAAVQGFHTLGRRPTPPGAVQEGYFFLALAAALTLPLLGREDDVLRSLRLSLLPLSPAAVTTLRLVLARPMRAAIAGLAWLFGTWAALGLRGPAGGLVVSAALAGWAVAAVAAAEVLEQTARRRFPALYHLLALYCAVLVLPLFLLFPDADAFGRLIRSLPEAVTAFLPFGEPGRPLRLGAVVLPPILALTAVAGAVRASRWLPAGEASRGQAAGVPNAEPRRPFRWAGARLGREFGFFRRVYFARALHLLAAVVAAFAVVTGTWWLLPAAALPWITLTHNLLGPDEPMGGRTRYRITTTALGHVVRARHVTLILVAAGILVPAALLGAFLHRDTQAWRWLTGAAFGVAVVAAAAITGNRFSIAYPRPAGLREILMSGGFLRRRSWLGVAATYGGCAGALVASVLAASRVPGLSPGASAAGAFLLAAIVLSAAYLAAARLSKVPDDIP